MSDGLTILLVLVFLLAYQLVVMWWREARADARLVPMGLATLQGLLVTAWIVWSDVVGHPTGPSSDTLVAMFLYANLPPSFVQAILAARRPGSRITIPHFAWMAIVFLGLLTLGEGADRLSRPLAIEAVALAIQVGVLVSLALVQAGIIGPGSRSS